MPQTGRMRGVDASRFSMVPSADIPRSAFDVQHSYKTTFNAGYLVPIYVEEVLPGDSFRLRMTAFCRTSTPLVPFMDNLEFESFFFFVPNRLVWDNFQRFMGEQISPTDSTSFLLPYVELDPGSYAPGSVADYFGLTVNNSGNTLKVSALPFRAYNLIWNEWFRHESLQTKVPEYKGDGPDIAGAGIYELLKRGKRHDYFTSALPWPEKPTNIGKFPDATGLNAGYLGQGFPGFSAGVNTPGSWPVVGAPVTGLGITAGTASAGNVAARKESGGRDYAIGSFQEFGSANIKMTAGPGGVPDVRVLVNDIRTALMVQTMLERNARGGTRYTELVWSHFRVKSPDARLQRPEYLGGGRTMVAVNPVAQTSATGVAGTTTKLGELAAIGSAMITNHGFSAGFTEHGFVLGMINIRSFLTYQNGNRRMWYRRTPFEIYWPGLANLGEQAIMRQEIYADASADDALVFGYQERWSEYKYHPSLVTGYFRSNAPTPLDMWHLAQNFGSAPVLNAAFIEDNPPVSRVLQVGVNFAEDFLFDSVFDVRMVRPMPVYSIPGLGTKSGI